MHGIISKLASPNPPLNSTAPRSTGESAFYHNSGSVRPITYRGNSAKNRLALIVPGKRLTLGIRRVATRSVREGVGCMPWLADIKAILQF